MNMTDKCYKTSNTSYVLTSWKIHEQINANTDKLTRVWYIIDHNLSMFPMNEFAQIDWDYTTEYLFWVQESKTLFAIEKKRYVIILDFVWNVLKSLIQYRFIDLKIVIRSYIRVSPQQVLTVQTIYARV